MGLRFWRVSAGLWRYAASDWHVRAWAARSSSATPGMFDMSVVQRLKWPCVDAGSPSTVPMAQLGSRMEKIHEAHRPPRGDARRELLGRGAELRLQAGQGSSPEGAVDEGTQPAMPRRIHGQERVP